MTEQTIPLTAQDPREVVGEFVAAVRRHLADLPPEEQQELTEGLEADLVEQLADDPGAGPDVARLGDPADYARELRLAAGLAPTGSGSRRRHIGLGDLLDEAHARWDRRAERLPGDTSGFLAALRPAWWLVRAWAAVGLGLVLIGHDREIAVVPAPRDNPAIGLALLAVALVGSVQVGRGRLWPGRWKRTGSTPARLLLLALNVLAAVTLPFVIGHNQITMAKADAYAADDSYAAGSTELTFFGEQVENIYPYDAQGHPLIGVQLRDQDGQRLTVPPRYGVLRPWTDADGDDLYDVFPLPSRVEDASGNGHGDARIRPPYRRVEPVTLRGFVASVLTMPEPATSERAGARRATKR